MGIKKAAFTLVELIVVITILAILGTIGFISLQGYAANARDSVRISDMKTFIKAINIYATKNNQAPMPDDSTAITGSGVTFSYQGTLSGGVITELKQGAVPLDPILGTPYHYAVNDTQTKFQILGFTEKNGAYTPNLAPEMYAAELTSADMFPRVVGDNLGIILDENNGTIATGSLAIHSTNDVYKYVISKSLTIIGTGSILMSENPTANCNRILTLRRSAGSGVYSLSADMQNTVDMYCDMDTDGGGWTLVYNQAWSGRDEIIGTIDSNTGTADLAIDHIRDASLLLPSGATKEVMIRQDDTWIVLADVDLAGFNDIFSNTSQTESVLTFTVTHGSEGPVNIVMDQTKHDIGVGVYQWNDEDAAHLNEDVCFDFFRPTGVDSNDGYHNWKVFAMCEGNGPADYSQWLDVESQAQVYIR